MTIKAYMIVTNDLYELPIKDGLIGAASVAEFLGLSVNRVRKNLCTGTWNHKQKYKAVVDENGTLEELEKRKKESMRKAFMQDRTLYFKNYHKRKKESAS